MPRGYKVRYRPAGGHVAVSYYLAVPLLWLVVVLQSVVVPHLQVGGVFPDLPLLVVVSWSLLRGGEEGLLWAFVGGLTLDLLSGAPLGAAALALMAVAFVVDRVRVGAIQTHLFLLPPLVLASTVLYDILFLLVLALDGRNVSFWGTLARIVLPSALFNALLMPLVFWPLRWLSQRLSPAAPEP